jgi:hypothetical protein
MGMGVRGVGGCLISDLQSMPRRIASLILNPSTTRNVPFVTRAREKSSKILYLLPVDLVASSATYPT